MTFTHDRLAPSASFGTCVLILSALTLVRLIGLHLSQVDLFYDESQYWAWARELQFGYYSKPPMIAWVIAATTAICGDGEACIRSSSPVFYLGTSLLCYVTAKVLYDERVALWAATSLALTIGISFSSRIISTDVMLLFFWSLALLAYVKLLQGGGLGWALTLGLATGLGILSKYSMLFFPAGVALAAVIDRDARALLQRREIWIAAVVAAVLIAPNLIWNAVNEFHTFKHTGDNVRGTMQFSICNGVAFVASQFVAIGPVVFAAFLVLLFRLANTELTRHDRLLLAFAIPVFAGVTAVALMRGANANWAAPGVISLTIVVIAYLLRRDQWRLLALSLGIGVAAQAAMLVGDANALRVSLPTLGAKADLYARTLGWSALGDSVRGLAKAEGAKTIVAENRRDMSSLLYYGRNEPQRVLLWPFNTSAAARFQPTDILTAEAAAPILLVSSCPATARLERYFDSVTPLGPLDIRTGPTSSRRYFAFRLGQPRGPIGMAPPCS